VAIVHDDFLRHPVPSTPYKVVGSIPFGARTSAILTRLTEPEGATTDAILIVQREAAERHAGGPYAPETLRSLLLKPWWQIEIGRRLRRTDFDPPPSVDTVVLWLARRTRPLVADGEAAAYRRFVRESFGRRGRTAGRCLSADLTRRQVRRLSADLRFDASAPPSHLSFDQWLGVFRLVAAKQ